MQFRELSSSELDEGFTLLSHLRLDLTIEQFANYINTYSPLIYRPIGAFERGTLIVYAGINIHENLEFGKYLIVDDFVTREGCESHSREMIEYLRDYGRMHGCNSVVIWGRHRGISIDDLEGFRPKRDGYILNV